MIKLVKCNLKCLCVTCASISYANQELFFFVSLKITCCFYLKTMFQKKKADRENENKKSLL